MRKLMRVRMRNCKIRMLRRSEKNTTKYGNKMKKTNGLIKTMKMIKGIKEMPSKNRFRIAKINKPSTLVCLIIDSDICWRKIQF